MSSVKTKLTMTLVQKFEIILHIGKGLTKKETNEWFGVLKDTISMWIRNDERISSWLHYKKLHHCIHKR